MTGLACAALAPAPRGCSKKRVTRRAAPHQIADQVAHLRLIGRAHRVRAELGERTLRAMISAINAATSKPTQSAFWLRGVDVRDLLLEAQAVGRLGRCRLGLLGV